MRRCASLFLSLSLVVLLFPTAAFAEGGNALAAAGVNLTAINAPEAASSSSGTSSGDVRHLVSKTLETKARTVPVATDFHDTFGVTYGYPSFAGNFANKVKDADGTDEDVTTQKQAVMAESTAILDYDAIDAQGNLYKNGVKKTATADGKTVTKLIRHTAGVENYGEAIPDNAPSTTKRLSIRMLRNGNMVTGLYAPPGEVVKVTLKATSADTAPQDLGLKALIGSFGSGTNESVIQINRFDLSRMPDLGIALALDEETTFIGSPLGGAILIYGDNLAGTTVEMEIEGAVEMPTYFYGEMSDSELAEQLSKPGPYFAFSTPRGIRAVGPASLVRNLSAQQIREAMEFWDKAIGVSYQFEATNDGLYPNDPDTRLMVESFDPYISVNGGYAVNLNGAYCVCPLGEAKAFFNRDTLVSSSSWWAAVHEMNHSFTWGGATDDTSEVSNNVINALTFQLYTNIAANRTEPAWHDNYGTTGLSGWSACADMFTTMERIRQTEMESYPNQAWGQLLQIYVPLQHAFGATRFLDAVHRYHEKGGANNTRVKKLADNPLYTNANVWMRGASEACGADLGYFMRDVMKFPELATGDASQTDYITTDVREALADTGPLFIPSGCLYASGFVYNAGTANEDVVEMGRPFRIPYGQAKVLDFNSVDAGGFVSVANGETVEVLSVTQPEHGTLAPEGREGVYVYTPDPNELSDTFDVTVKLTVTDPDSPYVDRTCETTYKISLLQDTSQYGFTTTFYDYPKTLADYDAQNTGSGAIAATIAEGVLDRSPSSVQVKPLAGFNAPGVTPPQEPEGRFAVVEGALVLPKTGDVELNVSGNVYYSTCFAATADDLPSAADAQSKLRGGAGRVHVYVVPSGGQAPADTSAYAAVVNEGEPLYVRAYVGMAEGCTCNYRLRYVEDGAVKDFPADAFTNAAPTSIQTPAIADFDAEKTYSCDDQPTFEKADASISCLYTWKEIGVPLTAYSGAPANITDGDPTTMFHSTTNGTPFTAQFIFQVDESTPFNAIRYRCHAGNPSRGRFKDYELYVSNDTNELLMATTSSSACVAHGMAKSYCDDGEYSIISWNEPTDKQLIRLVVTSSYPVNSEYYYAFSDFTIGTYGSISDRCTTVDSLNRVGDWSEETDLLLNTRSPLRTSAKGLGWLDFNGTDISLFATTSANYGTMRVNLDGEDTDIPLSSEKTLTQQCVFQKTGLDPDKTHRITFKPKNPGSDTINVEYAQIRGVPDGKPAIQAAPKKLTAKTTTASKAYTGSAIKPSATAALDGMDVTSLCSFSYKNNVYPGTATITATLNDDAGTNLKASASFKVTTAKLSAVKLNTVKTYPTSLQFPKQTPAGIGKTTGITFDVYVKEVKKGAEWKEKLSGLDAAKMKKKTYSISKLDANKTYQYQVRATRKVSGKAVATSTWTSGKIKTGSTVTPAIKSVKVSGVKVYKKSKKTYTKYKLRVTLSKKLGNGTQGIMASNGIYAKGTGTTFTLSFDVAGNKKGKSASVRLYGYADKTKKFGAYTNLSKAKSYKIK